MEKQEELADTLDEYLGRMLTLCQTVSQCAQIVSEAVERWLAECPEQAERLKPLLETALEIKRGLTTIKPSPEFRAGVKR
jgi:hypothetical protein